MGGQRWLGGLHLASLSSVSWPSHGPQKQRCRPKAVPSNPTCPGLLAGTSFAFLLHFCLYLHIYASAEKQAAPQRASVQDTSAREVAPLRSLVCNAFAMQKCSPVVNSRWKASVYRKPIPILAVK